MSLTTPSRSTLADVLAAIETAGLAERRRQDMTSAVRTVVKALGHPADRIGPMIINENTGLPYTANTYRTTWRIIADAAQLPPETQNRDSRSGSITEATDADTGLELTKNPGWTPQRQHDCALQQEHAKEDDRGCAPQDRGQGRKMRARALTKNYVGPKWEFSCRASKFCDTPSIVRTAVRTEPLCQN